MKHFLSVAIAAILVTGTASAQHANIGIKGGLNLYNVNSDFESERTSRIGFHAGLLGHIHLAENWALQPEITFSAQGAKYAGGVADVTWKLDYINVPVLVQYMFDNGFRLQAGPQIGFLISAKSAGNNGSTDIKDNLKTIDFGLGAGISYVHPPSGFGVDLRYNFGLSNINESSAVNTTNQGLQLGVFYLFVHQ